MRQERQVATPWPAFAMLIAGTAGAQQAATPDTVVVTGHEAGLAAAATEIASIPGGATLLDLADLGERHVGSLADALRYAPGVWAESDTGNDSMFFSSRGSNLDATDYDMNGIKLLQDGLPVTAADGNNHNRVVDPLAAGHASFARGANAMSFGASTLGGAVDFVTPTAEDGAASAASLKGGSNGEVLGRLTFGSRFGESADGLVTLEGRSWDGYRAHNEQDRAGIYANAGWRAGNEWSTRFYLTAIENDQELPGALTRAQFDVDPDQANPSAVIGHYQLNVNTERLANRTTWQIDADRRLDFGASLERQSLYHPVVWSPFFTLLIDTDQRDVGTMLRYGQRMGDHDLRFGLNYGENDVEGGNYSQSGGQPGALTSLVRNEASTAELFALDHWRLGARTTVVAAAQAVVAERDARTTAIASGSVSHPRASYDRINPRIGFIRSFGDAASLYGNLSSLFEPPTNFELEDNAAGNAALEAMQGSVIEIGARGGDGSPLFWDLSVYYAAIDDEILSVEDPAAPGTSLVTNVERTTHAGLEALFGGSFAVGAHGGAIEPQLALTWNDFRFDRDPAYGDNTLPAAPEYFMRAELIYRGVRGVFVGPTVDYVGERFADFANSYRIESHTLWGLRAGWTQGRWTAFAHIRNLADEHYVATHSVRNRAAANAPILNSGEPLSAYVGVEFALD